ncbi:MvaI/BcnI family restriction endonuclease [Bacillus vallismortis]|uniref:MvaI/BcnI family restriction endonuclease n=1 Tax=Bacillus vallismortis TaxID=72361 RepID=UPI0010097020|nr:MvaI/BcnI family restriction endonuclease [Bacillus vallismortis]MBG9770923.1 LlaMI restriction endonuclease [Bacillus vallismortis]MEC1268251.1 MvaI/BcnI family restriction endonuclease [Bacillus vallismortis]QAV10510.1 restriction endonuclease [Bacillus vallismortis]
MIFEPYKDEIDIINTIHKFNESEYVLIRLTSTMINKNNPDANALFRDLLKSKGIVDYEKLPNGGNKGHKVNAKLLLNSTVQDVKLNLYKVTGKRSDRRFSIYGIQKMWEAGKVNVCDLLYITVTDLAGAKQIVILNLTNNVPSEEVLTKVFGIDKVADSASRLLPQIKRIAQAGFHKNSKGSGKVSPKDVGDTLEFLLGIKTNNNQEADFEGKIEIKSKTGKTLDTLFTLRPQFGGTIVEQIEKNDRSRVSAFTRLYGYDSDKHLGYKSLYITVGTRIAPQNSLGFFLEVNEEGRRVELRKKNISNNVDELTAYWTFSSLESELSLKHPATLWVKAEQRMNGDTAEFRYLEAELSRSPQFTTFLSLIKSGGITYDWRGYTTPRGKYQGKNHGNAWRIRGKNRKFLFGRIETISLI